MPVNTKKVLIGGLVAGVVINVIDFALNTFILGARMKAEIIVENGKVKRIRYVTVGHVPPLKGARLKDFKVLVKVRAEDIVRKWIDFFVFKKQVKMERITKRVK